MPFSEALQSSITRINKCLRAYLKLTTCDDEEIYIRSHNDVFTPPESTSDAGIISIGNTSQSVNFSSSVTTTGSFSFKIADFDKNFSRWMRGLTQCGLAGSTVSIFIGYDDVSAENFFCAGTYIINNMRSKNKIYTFSAKDPQSQGNTDLFQEKCYKHFGDLYEDEVPSAAGRDVSEREDVIRRFSPNDSGDWGELFLLSDLRPRFDFAIADLQNKDFAQGTRLAGPFNVKDQAVIGFIKHECEVFLVEYNGTWSRDAINDDPFTEEDEGLSAISGHRYRILQRAVYDTQYESADDDGKVISDGDEFCIATILDGPANFILNAVMTGNDLEGNPVFPNDTTTRNAGIDQDKINLDCLEGFDSPMRFVCPPEYKAKTFWQDQILRWLDAYFVVSCEGQLCLTQRESPENSSVTRVIEQGDVINCGELQLDSDVTTSLFIAWDYDSCNENFLSTTGSFLDTEETKCLTKKEEKCQFLGVQTNLLNYQLVEQKMCRTLYRDGIPRWRFSLTVCIEFADLLPGSKVRVRNGLILDYLGSEMTMDRNFEINSVSPDWREGTVTFNLSAPIKENIGTFSLENCFKPREPCGTLHCLNRTDLADVIGSYTVPLGQEVTVPAGNYCVNGTLNVQGTLRQSTRGTLNIVATGGINVSGKIDTSGMGEPGQINQSVDEVTNAYGVNQGQGSRDARCINDFCDCTQDRRGFIRSGRTYQPFDIQTYGQTNAIDLEGAGGASGRDAEWYTNPSSGQASRGVLQGGAGGNGGGGLILGASLFSLSSGCINTSGYDGSVGESRGISSSGGGQDDQLTDRDIRLKSGLILHAGSGSGGNAGRVLIITDGPVPASIGSTSFLDSLRGFTPSATTGCHSSSLGSSNANREENIIQVTQLACGGRAIGDE